MVFLDYLIAGLLVVTIIYCWQLNRKIIALQHSKKEMLATIRQFDNSILRAEDTLRQFRHNSASLGADLQEKTKKAAFLADDLNFLIQRSASIADKMEAGIAASRAPAQPMIHKPAVPPRPAHSSAPRASLRTDTPASSTPEKRSTIDMLLEKLSGIGSAPEPKAPKPMARERQIAYHSPESLGVMPDLSRGENRGEDELLRMLEDARRH